MDQHAQSSNKQEISPVRPLDLGMPVPTDYVHPDASATPADKSEKNIKHLREIPVLNGWRGISILLVLATHMLPVGPKSWHMNLCTGAMGMSLFFTLSGFLITGGLLANPNVRTFFIRRFCRILPLVYAYMTIVLLILGKGPEYFAANFLFLINYDYAHMTPYTTHLWSVCVEMHFYMFVGLLVLFAGRRGLLILPVLALIVTALRIHAHAYININTHLRVDGILAGACLSLYYYHGSDWKPLRILSKAWMPFLLLILLVICSHPRFGPMDY
ncbi:MAG TPA: acyltransferase, partial [Tepidisphaeraceae bacterium]|nr:acyltransferase [Tepidisphaeraceae bacterium]